MRIYRWHLLTFLVHSIILDMDISINVPVMMMPLIALYTKGLLIVITMTT